MRWGMRNLIFDHFLYQQPFDSKFEAEQASDWFCKEGMLGGRGGKAAAAVSSVVQQELLMCPQIWPETKHRLLQLQWKPSRALSHLLCKGLKLISFPSAPHAVPSQHDNVNRSFGSECWSLNKTHWILSSEILPGLPKQFLFSFQSFLSNFCPDLPLPLSLLCYLRIRYPN